MDPNYPALMECPYDSTHMILPLRMPHHLIKCRKNFPSLDYAVCPYNSLHEVPRAELRYHMMNCRDRSLLEKEIIFDIIRKSSDQNSNRVLKGFTDLPMAPDRTTETENETLDEDWDSERHYGTFSIIPQQTERKKPFRRSTQETANVRRPTSEGMAARLTTVTAQCGEPSPIEKPQPVFNHSICVAHGRGITRSALPTSNIPGTSASLPQPALISALSAIRPGPPDPISVYLGSLARGRGLLANRVYE